MMMQAEMKDLKDRKKAKAHINKAPMKLPTTTPQKLNRDVLGYLPWKKLWLGTMGVLNYEKRHDTYESDEGTGQHAPKIKGSQGLQHRE